MQRATLTSPLWVVRGRLCGSSAHDNRDRADAPRVDSTLVVVRLLVACRSPVRECLSCSSVHKQQTSHV